MAVEASLRSKYLYKIEISIIKYIPFLIAGIYFINTFLSLFGIEAVLCSYIAGLSFLPWLFLLLSSFVFRFCSYHRIPLYYIIVNDVINITDEYIGIPIDNKWYIILHLILFSLCFITVFALRKKCNNDKHIKTIST